MFCCVAFRVLFLLFYFNVARARALLCTIKLARPQSGGVVVAVGGGGGEKGKRSSEHRTDVQYN